MTMPNQQFDAQKSFPERVMVQCRTLVDRNAVSRSTIEGVEHITVTSSTLPDDVVMNNIFYPSSEIESSFESLEMTLAPVEHPQINGQFVPASDPRAINAFYAGAWNTNVRRKDGRVWIDKVINVQEASKTDRGKRLLDRINELEQNDSPRPIHTSVGVFLTVDELEQTMTNNAGQEYRLVARDMVFDHDAILLDSTGAATPEQGVGMAVNKSGDQFEVSQISLGIEEELAQQESMSFSQVVKALEAAFIRSAVDADSIEEVFQDKVIFWSKDQMFEVPFSLSEDGMATIAGIPTPVDRSVSFVPKTNQEGDPMKEMILNSLSEAGVQTDGLTDEELFSAFQGLKVNNEEEKVPEVNIGELVANAVKDATAPLIDELNGLKAEINASDSEQIEKLASIVANSDKYPGIDAETAKSLGKAKLAELAANCNASFGLSPVFKQNNDGQALAPVDMPE